MSWRNDLLVFLLVAFGMSWLFALPIWVSGGSFNPSATIVTGLAMMTTPTLAVLAVWRLRHRERSLRDWARQCGMTLGERRNHTIAMVAAAWFGVPLLAVVAVAVSAAVGVLSVDVGGLSLYRQMLQQAASGQDVPLDPAILAVAQFGAAVLVAPWINAIPALGEEWGWRGWLLPHLLRLGTWPALLLSGVIWVAWHAPLIGRRSRRPAEPRHRGYHGRRGLGAARRGRRDRPRGPPDTVGRKRPARTSRRSPGRLRQAWATIAIVVVTLALPAGQILRI